MPLGDGKGPPWGSGPGTGQRRGRCDSAGKSSWSSSGSKSQSLIAIIGSAIALATSIVKLLSSKKQENKK